MMKNDVKTDTQYQLKEGKTMGCLEELISNTIMVESFTLNPIKMNKILSKYENKFEQMDRAKEMLYDEAGIVFYFVNPTNNKKILSGDIYVVTMEEFIEYFEEINNEVDQIEGINEDYDTVELVNKLIELILQK